MPQDSAEFRTLGPVATGGEKQPTLRTAHGAPPKCPHAALSQNVTDPHGGGWIIKCETSLLAKPKGGGPCS